MPFSTALATPLSNFEANQEMKKVVDPAGLFACIEPVIKKKTKKTKKTAHNRMRGSLCVAQCTRRSRWWARRMWLCWHGPRHLGRFPATWHSVCTPSLSTPSSLVRHGVFHDESNHVSHSFMNCCPRQQQKWQRARSTLRSRACWWAPRMPFSRRRRTL